MDSPAGRPGASREARAGVRPTPEAVATTITCVDYSPTQERVEEVTDAGGFGGRHRPDWSAVRWVSVVGLRDVEVVRALAEKYELHPLSIEDLLSGSQRPKVDAFGGGESGHNARLFITTRALEVVHDELRSDQISIYLGHHTVLTFEEHPTGLWDPIHRRLRVAGSRVRDNDASFLVYSLLDAVVDDSFPVLDHYDGRLEQLETAVVEQPDPAVLSAIQQVKRELAVARAGVWPMREVVATLRRDPHECMSETTKVFLGDIHDHLVQIVEIIGTYRERASDLTESYRSAVTFRTNEVMKVLTMIGTIFIPLTFFAGVYGMNFEHIPELSLVWAYPAFWVISLVVAATMVQAFRRRGWF